MLVGAVVTREPEFTPDQVAVLLAHLANEADRGPHGLQMSEVTDPANQFAYDGAKAPLIDWAEKARLDAQQAYYDLHDQPKKPVNRHGHIFSVKKKT